MHNHVVAAQLEVTLVAEYLLPNHASFSRFTPHCKLCLDMELKNRLSL